MTFKRRAPTEAKPKPATRPAPKPAKLKEREFLRNAETAPDSYELARPVRVVFRLSEAEAEKLRQVCFEQRVTTQAFVIGLLANAGICEM